jgi:hypothetical protein
MGRAGISSADIGAVEAVAGVRLTLSSEYLETQKLHFRCPTVVFRCIAPFSWRFPSV